MIFIFNVGFVSCIFCALLLSPSVSLFFQSFSSPSHHHRVRPGTIFLSPKILDTQGCNAEISGCARQLWRYTRARQVKWPGWKIRRPGSSLGSALPSPAYCFASVIVWIENKNVTISDRFICFISTVKRRWRRGWQLKKVVKFYEEKVHPGDLAGGFSDLEMT